jgi:hypothetical protein
MKISKREGEMAVRTLPRVSVKAELLSRCTMDSICTLALSMYVQTAPLGMASVAEA